jgi:colicin import membrane protein
MAEQKESSVLFSLKELMNLEEDRIKQEDEEKKKRAEADMRSRQDSEKRAREEEEMRLKGEEERRRLEEQRKKEEAARVEGARAAEIEKARIEAEQRARMESLTQQQEHERQLSALQHDSHKKKLERRVSVIAGSLVAVLAIFLGVYFGKIKPEQERKEREAAAAIAQQQEDAARKAKDLERLQTQVNELLSQLTDAKSDADKASLKAKIAEAQSAAAALRRVGGGGAAAAGGAKSDKPCKCQAGDPLCSCL